MKYLNISTFLFINSILTSCSNQFGIGIYSIADDKTNFIPSESFREIIVGSSPEVCEFSTFQQITNDFLMRKRDCEGGIISEISNLVFHDIYSSRTNYLTSQNGSLIAFYQSGAIFLYDIDKREKDILLAGIDEEVHLPVHYIEFLSQDEILVVAKLKNLSHSDFYTILRIDTKSREKTVIFTQVRPGLSQYGTYATTKNNEIFTFFQGSDYSSIYGDIVFLNLETRNIVDVIINESKKLIGNFAWSPNQKLFSYVKDDNIIMVNMSDKSQNIIKILDEYQTCFDLEFLSNEALVYSVSRSGKNYSVIKLDINSGEEDFLFSSNITGSLRLIDNRKKILYQNGY
jgi:hypothetical protein